MIDDFEEFLQQLIPSLFQHACWNLHLFNKVLFKSFELCFSALRGNYSWLQHNYTQLTVQTQV